MSHDQPFDLSGRSAVVTGGAGGIGRAVARRLATAGARIVIADVDADQGRHVADALAADTFIELDVTQPLAVDAAVDAAQTQLGAVDILVNCVGIARNVASEAMTDTQWESVIDINLNGLFRCCRGFGQAMLARRSGTIVNVASMSGVVVNKPQPQAAYNASKAGVIMLTKSLAVEWADRGVRVNAVSPGYIDTEMTQLGLQTPEWKRTWLEMTPMGRIGQPDEVANAVWYLVSDAASYTTGCNLIVDGGYTAW